MSTVAEEKAAEAVAQANKAEVKQVIDSEKKDAAAAGTSNGKEAPPAEMPIDIDFTVLALALVLKPQFYVSTAVMGAWVCGHWHTSFVWVVFLCAMVVGCYGLRLLVATKKRVSVHANKFYDPVYPGRESVYWIVDFIQKVYDCYPETVNKTVKDIVNQQLAANKPAFLDSLECTYFNMGTFYPVLSNFKTWDESMQVVKFDCDFAWEADWKIRVVAKKFDPTFISRMRVVARFLPNNDLILCYLALQLQEQPEIETCVSLWGVDITAMPFVMTTIRGVIAGVCGELLVAPAKVEVDVAKLMGVQVKRADLLPKADQIEKSGLIGGVFSGVGSVVGGVASIGGSVVGGAAQGVGAVAGGVAGGVGAVAGSVSGFFKKQKKEKSTEELLDTEEQAEPEAAPASPAPEVRAAPTIELEEPAPAAQGERAPTPEPSATLSHGPPSVTPEPAMQKSAPGSRPTTPFSGDEDSGRLSDSQLDGADDKPGRKTSFMSKFKGGFKKH